MPDALDQTPAEFVTALRDQAVLASTLAAAGIDKQARPFWRNVSLTLAALADTLEKELP